jgi:hypothetical protein
VVTTTGPAANVAASSAGQRREERRRVASLIVVDDPLDEGGDSASGDVGRLVTTSRRAALSIGRTQTGSVRDQAERWLPGNRPETLRTAAMITGVRDRQA